MSVVRTSATSVSHGADAEGDQFNALLALVGVPGALGSRGAEALTLVTKSRQAALTKLSSEVGARSPAAASSGPAAYHGRLVVVPADLPVAVPQAGASPVEAMWGVLAATLQAELDPLTAATAAGAAPADTSEMEDDTNTTDGPTASATTRTSLTVTTGVAGSQVKASVHFEQLTTITDKTSGATLAETSTDYSKTGIIDVCPSTTGVVAAMVTTDIQIAASVQPSAGGAGSNKSASAESSSTFEGHVTAAAELASVTQDFQDNVDWKTTTPSGSTTTEGGANVPVDGISYPGSPDTGVDLAGVDMSNVSGQYTLSGAATEQTVAEIIGNAAVLDAITMTASIKEARTLWRGGRCVVAVAPDYNAETPIKIGDQSAVQHDETVDPSSMTTFAVKLRHRFGPIPQASVDAAITSGSVKIAPTHLAGVPGSLVYTAPPDEGKTSTVTLTSTSNRGIGKLVLSFTTKPPNLTLAISGTLVTGIAQAQIDANVKAAATAFKRTGDNQYQATLPLSATFRFAALAGLPGPSCQNFGTETGSILMNATMQPQGDAEVWIVTPNPVQSAIKLTYTCIVTGGQGLSGGGGYTVKFLAALGTLTIPATGGVQHVHKVRTLIAGVSDTADATVTASTG